MCKKATFQTKEQAIKRVEEIRLADKRDRTPHRAYKCKECGFFHLTSIKKSVYVEMVLKGGNKKRWVDKIANYWMEKKGWNDKA